MPAAKNALCCKHVMCIEIRRYHDARIRHYNIIIDFTHKINIILSSYLSSRMKTQSRMFYVYIC